MHKQMRGAASCALTERVTLCSKISRKSLAAKIGPKKVEAGRRPQTVQCIGETGSLRILVA